jgi:hypothetical protein
MQEDFRRSRMEGLTEREELIMKFPLNLMNKAFAARILVFAVCVAAMTISVSAQKTFRKAFETALAPDAIGIDIEQCANGPLAMPIRCNVASGNDGWSRGNVNESKSHYYEGDSVPIRFIATGLTPGETYTVTLGYDFTKGGKYATDYLTDYDRTENVDNDPCIGVAGCTLASETTFPIPLDPQVANGFDGAPGGGDDIVQIPGSFSCFGCTITAVTGYTLSGSTASDSSKTFTITFTANAENIVIAYGAHISTRSDWGLLNSAINISGSPYHNFVVDFPGANGGSRDLQLAAAAVIFPARVTVVKTVATNLPGFPPGTTSTFEFDFMSSANFGVTSFSLIDNVEGAGGGSIASPNITLFGSGNSITVTEADYSASGWSLAGLLCVNDSDGLPHAGSVENLGTRTTVVTLAEGDFVTCTFHNSQFAPTAAPASVSGRVTDSFGVGIGGARISMSDAQSGNTWSVITNPFGFYTIEGPEAGNFYIMSISHKRYNFADDTRTFTLNEDLVGMDFVANP